MKNLYKGIAERLLSILHEGKPLIQHVAIMDMARSGDVAHDFPAVYIDIPSINWELAGQHLQVAEQAIINLYVVQATLQDTYINQESSQDNLDSFLKIFDVIEAVYLAMQGFKVNGEFFSSSKFNRIAQVVNNEIFIGATTYMLTFKAALHDISTSKAQLYAELPPIVVEME